MASQPIAPSRPPLPAASLSPPLSSPAMATIGDRSISPSFTGFGVQVGITVSVTAACVIAYEFMRRMPSLRHMLLTRCDLTRNPTPEPSKTPFAWIWNALVMSESFLLHHVGLDAVMHLRFLRSGFLVYLVGSVIIAPILLPLNYGFSKIDLETIRDDGLDLFSIVNIAHGSSLLYAHMVMLYVLTAVIAFRLYRDAHHYVELHQEFGLAQARDGGIAPRTVMVTNLPRHLRDEDALKEHFDRLNVGQVENATIARYPDRLVRKLARREKALLNLETKHLELAHNVLRYIRRHRIARSMLGSVGDHPLCPDSHDSDASLLHAEIGSALPLERESTMERCRGQFERFARKLITRTHAPAAPSNAPERGDDASDALDAEIPAELGLTRRPSRLSILLSPIASEVAASRSITIPSESEHFWQVLCRLPPGLLDRFHPVHRPILPNARWVIPIFSRRRSDIQTSHRIKRLGTSGTIPLATPEAMRMRKRPKSAIDHYMRKFNRLDHKVQELRSLGIRECAPATATGFVTFSHPASAYLCAQAVVSRGVHDYQVTMAPEPRDVVWASHAAGIHNRVARKLLINAGVWALTIFWLFPMSFVLYLTSYATIQQNLPWLAPVLTSSITGAIIKDLLPTMITAICLSVLPFVIFGISKQEYLTTYSGLEWAVMNRYYRFAFFNVLVVFLIGSGFLTYFVNLLQKPTDLFDTLAVYIPAGATYFVNYVIFATSVHALEIVVLFIQFIAYMTTTTRWISTLPRILQQHEAPYNFVYFYYFPIHILIFNICVTYALINPFIIFCGLIYFGIGWLVFKHQFAHVYVRRYEGGGKAWRNAFNYVFDGLIFAQLTMISMFALKEVYAAAAAIIPLLIFTIFARVWIRRRFRRRMKFIPLESLRDAGCAVRSSPRASEALMDAVKKDHPLPVVSQCSVVGRDKRETASFGSLSISSDSSGSDAVKDSSNTLLMGLSDAKDSLDGPSADSSDDANRRLGHIGAGNRAVTHLVTNESVVPLQASDVAIRRDRSRLRSRTTDGATDLAVQQTPPSLDGVRSDDSRTVADLPVRDDPRPQRQRMSLTLHLRGFSEPSPQIGPIHDDVEGVTTQGETSAERPRVSEQPVEIGAGVSRIPSFKLPPALRARFQSLKGFALTAGRHGRSASAPLVMTSAELSQDSQDLPEDDNQSCDSEQELPYDEKPNRETVQDMRSDPDEYVHPALLTPLHVRLWLPNPRKGGPVKLDECVELDHALVSSQYRGSSRLGYRPPKRPILAAAAAAAPTMPMPSGLPRAQRAHTHSGEVLLAEGVYSRRISAEPIDADISAEQFEFSVDVHAIGEGRDVMETQSLATSGFTSSDSSDEE